MSDETISTKNKITQYVVTHKLNVTLLFVTIVAVSASLFFYLQYSAVQGKTQADQQLVERISQNVQLPTDETPIVVTVASKTKLTNKQLAKKVHDGDKLIIYSANRRIIVFRPSTEKIVDILSFNNIADLPKK